MISEIAILVTGTGVVLGGLRLAHDAFEARVVEATKA